MRALPALLFGSVLLCGAAGAADQPVRELEPVHVNAMRDPEVRKYKVILAGLDAFDDYHRMAPRADRLRFRLDKRSKVEDTGPAPAVRLVGNDGFKLPLPIGADGRFTVPRSDEAEDADSELELNRKRKLYRIAADIRTPGLAPNQRRLGDLRLECRVTVAMAKVEIPFVLRALINSILLTTDWCSFFDNKKNTTFSFTAEQPVLEAVLVEGNRSALLRSSGRSYSVPLGEGTWSDDAIIELQYAPPAADKQEDDA
ncbi:hypothetical protein [uncultured Massilia sp.]|uniref:hypothetical protein n=1 Tax=uncultured Massilia sp. TaxID=169973 RepID=UPI00258BDFAC|nr:hypothetical protein [uncultured Massilia sp.]